MGTEITLSSDRVYEGRVIHLRVDTVRLADGGLTKREIVEHRGAVALVAVGQDDNVLLVKQYRKAAGKDLLEIPAGTLELGENPLDCAQRELQEETGHKAARIEPLTGFYPCPGYSTEFIHVYVATGLQPSVAEHDDDEDIEVVPVPFPEALKMVGSGEICDAKSIIGLLAYARRKGM
ncbi:MAG: NUDIX hydrolase [Chloroflexi bacterium]|nr:NUDIX hydrolase [Chloroflexota bacterium]MDA8187114.1 NUDIX hydrolase [Dehalococcoidales bacterium]